VLDNNSFAIVVTADSIDSLVQCCWDGLITSAGRIIDRNGNPDPNGKNRLDAYQLSYSPPATITLVISGTHLTDAPFSNAPFTATYVDTLSVADGRVVCSSSSTLDVDTSAIERERDALAAFVGAPLPFGPIAAANLVDYVNQQIRDGLSGLQLPQLSPGRLASNFFVSGFNIPNTQQRVVFIYDSAGIDSRGIIASGIKQPSTPDNPNGDNPFNRTRRGFAAIIGPRNIRVNTHLGTPKSVTRSYSVGWGEEMQLPMSLIDWHESEGSVLNDGNITTPIQFNVGDMVDGDVRVVRLKVNLQDEDGISATAKDSVTIEFFSQAPQGAPHGHKRLAKV
jgi:hypothetical protein